MENITALLASVIYVFASLVIVVVFDHFSTRSKEVSRKMLHILTGNWILISLLFTNLFALLLLPAGLLVLNLLSLRFNLVKAMERDDDSWGTVFYPLSIMILSAIGFVIEMPVIPVTGIMILGYGDGLAAITGGKWGHWRPFKIAPKKSFVGSLTVVLIGFAITFGALLLFEPDTSMIMTIGIAINTALLASLLELVGKKGSDNLTLPIGTGMFVAASLIFPYWQLLVASLLILAGLWVMAFRK